MLEQLKELIAEKLDIDVNEIKPEARFNEDLGADSLDLFEVIMAIEEEYNISINNEDLEKIKTVQDAINYINEQI